MESIGTQVFEKYGLAGLVFLFCGYIIWLVLSHFMRTVDRKDEQINAITEQFTKSLDENTKATHQLAEANIQLANSTQNMIDGYDRLAAQNRDEHGQILEYIRKKVAI